MIAIIHYNAGNIRSVQNALQRLGCESTITDKKNEILNAEKVIFPGVGHAAAALHYLREKKLDAVIKSLKQPVLGICLGLQLLCKKTAESEIKCLGIFNADVKKFPQKDKVPHMGWNNFSKTKGKLLKNITPEKDVYYVHSYYAELCEETSGICDYILPFSAVLEKDNFFATQFHPEKSGKIGAHILKNFLAL